MSIWRFSDRLSWSPPEECRLTLGEGGTPLLRSRAIGTALGLKRLYFKLESLNPTGSYKDRFAAAAVGRLRELGSPLCLGTSSGNTGAALAAYSAAAGMACVLALVETAPEEKLLQMSAHGAALVRIRGFGIDAETTREIAGDLRSLANKLSTPLQISAYQFAPEAMGAVETISHEIAEQTGGEVAHVFSPSGGGGLTLAVARGFRRAPGIGDGPAVHCVQPEGNNTIAGPLREGLDRARPCICETSISGLQVATVLDGTETLRACRESGGTGYLVPDQEVFTWQTRLAREEGILTEPAGAVALAGAALAVKRGELSASEPVVCLVTGSGFKDHASLRRMAESATAVPTVESVAQFSARMGLA